MASPQQRAVEQFASRMAAAIVALLRIRIALSETQFKRLTSCRYSALPFGNTNGVVDAFSVGLPGICKTGREVFERIDGAMFMRAYMPGWMVAETAEEYIEAAVRLANNHDERESLRRYMLEKNVVQRFFEGRPEVFGEMVLDLVNEQRLRTA